jgi:hypothetical protein
MSVGEVGANDSDGWAPISEPLRMFRKELWRCGLFLVVNLVFGLLSFYVALLVPIFSPSHNFSDQFLSSLSGGALYTFAIALLSSNAVFLLQGQSKRAIEHVRKWKISAVAIALLLVGFMGVLAGMQAWADALKQPSSALAIGLQIFITLIGVAIAIYCFLLAIYEEDLDDFAAKESVKRQELSQKSKATDSDGRGIEV